VEEFWIEHGFSTEKCEAVGMPLPEALAMFAADLESCDYLVSHNMDYDFNVLGAEMMRYKARAKRTIKLCTKEAATDFCAIPFPGQRPGHWNQYKPRYKWPKLSELHEKLFGQAMVGGHQAGEDVTALKNCFFKMRELGIITLPDPAA
jgi:DNA polymerase III epsilon subunit-like protein